MTQRVNFTFEGFEIQAYFSKDEEPPYNNWELDGWKYITEPLMADNILTGRLVCTVKELQERIEAACYEALENYDKNDYIDEEH